MGTRGAVAIGAGLGLLAVAVIVAMTMAGLVSGSAGQSQPPQGPVVVILTAPDESGVVLPRVIDVYSPLGAITTVRSVDPSSPATVSGTTASTLSDAYSFGGPNAVVSALGSSIGAEKAGWAVVGPEAWQALVGSDTVHLDLPQGMQVFDGAQLYAFSAGPQDVPADQIAPLFDGVTYLSAADQKAVREQVGDVLASRLASSTPAQAAALQSPFEADALQKWLSSLGSPRRSEAQ